MIDEPILKRVPADFLVRENAVLPLTGVADATWQYLLLHKCGYTTMEAVRLIADHLGLSTMDVTYGGLKDEDAITEQLVAVPVGAVPADTPGSGWSPAVDADRWMRLSHYGYGRDGLSIGQLEGNGFRIVLRNLSTAQADGLARLRKVILMFLNYYDTQRFSVPGGPKLTHLVGRQILAEAWDDALQSLIALDAPESALAKDWPGEPRDFFQQLDSRVTSFYLAAHASYQWNADLRDLTARVCPGEYVDVELEGLAYRYVRSSEAAAGILAHTCQLPYLKYTFDNGLPVGRTSKRATVAQAVVSIADPAPDEFAAGRCRVTLGFFLPSGCYATAAVRQLVAHAEADSR